MKLRILTAGESHGKYLTGIIEGLPAGLDLSEEDINIYLARRQKGYGRGRRMEIEQDSVEICSAVRGGKTTGAPVSLRIENNDYENWKEIMSLSGSISEKKVSTPRPGHADLAGALKYGERDLRNIIERASARETAIRTALGAIAVKMLSKLDIFIGSAVVSIGNILLAVDESHIRKDFFLKAENSLVRCPCENSGRAMVEEIKKAEKCKTSLGGSFITAVFNVPAGLGSHVHYDRKLDAMIGSALLSINAVKAVEIGDAVTSSTCPGKQVQDEIFRTEEKGFYRKTNHAGGIEGGISNGSTIWAKSYMKPIPTQAVPLHSVNISSGKSCTALKERADCCAVPAASVVSETVMALVIADALLDKFGSDSMNELYERVNQWRKKLKELL